MAMVKMSIGDHGFLPRSPRLTRCCPKILQSRLGPSRTGVLRLVEKYFFDGLAKDASYLESERETGIVSTGLDGNDGGAGDTNVFGEFCLRPFALSS
jgi:hypothetical protein